MAIRGPYDAERSCSEVAWDTYTSIEVDTGLGVLFLEEMHRF